MNAKTMNSTRRWLLMITAVILVAAISISVTLAYLTAQTDIMTNTFQAAGGITGKVIETQGSPNGDSDVNFTYKPGEETEKDPMVQNTTTDTPIYVGVRVDYYIALNDESYVQVSYTLFDKYVGTYFNTTLGVNTSKWTEFAVNEAPNLTGFTDGTNIGSQWSRYYVYNDKLGVGADTDTATYSSKNNYTYSAHSDSFTQPLFTSVKPNGAIQISGSLDTDDTAQGKATSANDEYATKLYKDGPQAGDIYKNFKFKIVVTGYGVRAADGVVVATAKSDVQTYLKGMAMSGTKIVESAVGTRS